MPRTVLTIEVPVDHRFVVGNLIRRQEKAVGDDVPADEQFSLWQVIEIGCSAPVHQSGGFALWDGPWYRMAPVNEIARLLAMEAHGRVAKASTPLVNLMGPVTERVRTVDRMCEPHVR